MAYTAKTWVTGEVIQASDLNHAEQGIAAISANGAIDTANLANASVTNEKLDQEAVDSNNIRAGAIITPLIYDGAVTDAKLAASGVKSDVADLKSAITNVENEINGELFIPIDGNEIVQGTYGNSSAVVSNNARIRTSGMIRIFAGQTVVFNAGQTAKQMLYGIFNDDGTLISESGWMGDGKQINFGTESNVVFVFRKGASDAISPADYDAKTKIISKSNYDIAELGNAFDKLSNTVGKAGTSFVGTGSTHSSLSDAVKISINAGERFTVTGWNSNNISNPNAQIYAYYSDGTYEKIGTITVSNQAYSFTAVKSIEKIGIFHATVSGVTYSYEVVTDGWVCDSVKSATEKITRIVKFSNGSGGNPGNNTLVTARAVPLVSGTVKIVVRNARPVGADGNYYRYDISAWKGGTWYTNRKTAVVPNDNGEIYFTNADIISYQSDVTGFGITIHEYDSDGVEQTLRYGDFANYPLIVRYLYDDRITSLRDIDNQTSVHDLLNARHCTNPLTILHFSDLHADTAALKRIVDDANYYYGANINEKICTGDMVANTAEHIASWWDSSVLTCIGNHDTASYSNGAYDWTALSMADRDAYYIAPFESGWGITHTSGKSYYYKDYATQKVRLIVMDDMLYNDNGTEATAQTAWLSDLLSSAITSGYHVLIAIHAPHGGATAEECSFSRYGQTAMPTYTDCNTPQSVIDAVASAILNGLHFIGYIVGHMHQDNIWDAEGDGKQHMYCVTCAAQASNAQWKNSDQDRSGKVDAYNLISIDTMNTLVKIVRGGGANIDDHMRTRKAICFNYSTGEKVGEIL